MQISRSFPSPAVDWPLDISPAVELHRAGLVLGQGTQLVRLVKSGDLAVGADRDRCLALLSVAWSRPVSADVIRHFEAAATHFRCGDAALANLRLIVAGLPRLDEPADAYRLRAAEYLLDEGMSPRELMMELGLDSSVLDLGKYDQDQPRVPAGRGRESGRWTDGSGGGSPSAIALPTPSALLIPIATTGSFPHACKALGIDPIDASAALHAAKKAAGLSGADNCTFDLNNGDIFFNGEHIGNLGD